MKAIELNGVSVGFNKAAFNWGRTAAHDLPSVQKLVAPAKVIEFKRAQTLDDLVKRRVERVYFERVEQMRNVVIELDPRHRRRCPQIGITFDRMPPGETDRTKAVKTSLAELTVGDGVYVRGFVAADRKSVPAQQIVVNFPICENVITTPLGGHVPQRRERRSQPLAPELFQPGALGTGQHLRLPGDERAVERGRTGLPVAVGGNSGR